MSASVPPLDSTFGALLLGCLVSVMLYGVSVVQYLHYHSSAYASQFPPRHPDGFDAIKQTIKRISGSFACSYVASLCVEKKFLADMWTSGRCYVRLRYSGLDLAHIFRQRMFLAIPGGD
jgi:hypothetical protein